MESPQRCKNYSEDEEVVKFTLSELKRTINDLLASEKTDESSVSRKHEVGGNIKSL